MIPKSDTADSIRTLLLILLFSFLTLASFWILRPFLSPLVWAVMIVIATWPLMLAVERRFSGRRGLAVLAMSLALGLMIFVPVWLTIRTIVGSMDTMTSWVQTIGHLSIPEAPTWVSDIPIVGQVVTRGWNKFAGAGRAEITTQIAPFLGRFIEQVPAKIGDIGMIVLHLLLTMVFVVILYLQGERAAGFARAFARRLAGDRGEQTVELVALSIKAVAMGIVVTALVQATFAGIGLLIVGVPYALLLTALIFALSIVQIGAGPVLISAIIWLFWSGQTGWGAAFLIWSVFVMLIDNFLRPVLIKRGADLPLLLIFAGVIGGMISFGLLGLFVGPVILAVTYTLCMAWIDDQGPKRLDVP